MRLSNIMTAQLAPSTDAPEQSKAPRGVLLLVMAVLLIAAVLVGREVYARLIAPGPPLNFDEAAHSLPGYYIMRDVLRLDLKAFWIDTHIQTLWPPGFSWMQAPFLFVLGRTDEGARLFAYIVLVLVIFMAGAIAHAIRKVLAPMALLTTGLIMLSAPGWLSLGGLALQEMPVALATLIAFWCFLRAKKTGHLHWHIITGVMLFLLFLTKYNYAAFAVAAVGLVDMGERVRLAWSAARHTPGARLRAFDRQFNLPTLLGLYLPLMAGLLVWFLGGTDVVGTEVKWRDFSFFVSNENSGYAFWSAENLLFYVRATVDWLMASPLLAVATVIGAGWALARIRHPGVTLLALFFGIGFILATAHQLKSDRYIAPLFPALWIMAGLGYADLWLRIQRRASTPTAQRWVSVGFIAIAGTSTALALVSSLPRLQPAWAGDIADALRAASNQIVEWQQPDRPVLIIGTFGELGPPLFEWRLRPQATFANGNIQYNAPPGDGELIERVEHWLAANPGAQVTLIQLRQDSALYNTHDVLTKNAVYQTLAADFQRQTRYRQVNTVSYLDGGLVIRYYLPE